MAYSPSGAPIGLIPVLSKTTAPSVIASLAPTVPHLNSAPVAISAQGSVVDLSVGDAPVLARDMFTVSDADNDQLQFVIAESSVRGGRWYLDGAVSTRRVLSAGEFNRLEYRGVAQGVEAVVIGVSDGIANATVGLTVRVSDPGGGTPTSIHHQTCCHQITRRP